MSQTITSSSLDTTTNENNRVEELTFYQRSLSYWVKQKQETAFISAIFASISLLIFIISLIVPGAPLALVIISGVACSGLTILSLVSFALYFINLRKIFLDRSHALFSLKTIFKDVSLDVARPERPEEPIRDEVPIAPRQHLFSSFRAVEQLLPPVLNQENSIAPIEQQGQLALLPIDQEDLDVLEGASEEERRASIDQRVQEETNLLREISLNIENICVSNRLQKLKELSGENMQHDSIDRHPRYKRDVNNVLKQFDNFCEGILHFITCNNPKGPVSAVEFGTMFMRRFNPNTHPVLRVTCNARDLLNNENFGMFWLHSAFKDTKAAASLWKLISAGTGAKCDKEKLSSKLQLINLLLSGWCLSTPENINYIFGSVQSLPIPANTKETILNLLSGGNVLGALLLLHKDTDGWNDILKYSDPLQPDQSFLLPIEELNLTIFRTYAAYIDSKESKTERVDATLEYCKSLFERLAGLLPTRVLFLIRDIGNNQSQLNQVLRETRQVLTTSMSPQSLDEVFVFLRAARSVELLQTRLENYLPHAGRDAINGLLSNLFLGSYSLGIFTKKQIASLGIILGISQGNLINAINSRKLAKTILPKLL